MTQKTRTQLEAYFETGDYPTQSEFTDFVESTVNIQDDGATVGGEGSIAAYAGGGQANATQLTKKVNSITTCASDHDSVKLPTGVPGMTVYLVNATAKILDVYPATGGQINLLGVNNPYSVASGKVVGFGCAIANGWAALLGA